MVWMYYVWIYMDVLLIVLIRRRPDWLCSVCLCSVVLYRGFGKEFDPSIDQVVGATLSVYKAAMEHLLPTPNKSHYLFNLRDFSRVMQVRQQQRECQNSDSLPAGL